MRPHFWILLFCFLILTPAKAVTIYSETESHFPCAQFLAEQLIKADQIIADFEQSTPSSAVSVVSYDLNGLVELKRDATTQRLEQALNFALKLIAIVEVRNSYSRFYRVPQSQISEKAMSNWRQMIDMGARERARMGFQEDPEAEQFFRFSNSPITVSGLEIDILELYINSMVVQAFQTGNRPQLLRWVELADRIQKKSYDGGPPLLTPQIAIRETASDKLTIVKSETQEKQILWHLLMKKNANLLEIKSQSNGLSTQLRSTWPRWFGWNRRGYRALNSQAKNTSCPPPRFIEDLSFHKITSEQPCFGGPGLLVAQILWLKEIRDIERYVDLAESEKPIFELFKQLPETLKISATEDLKKRYGGSSAAPSNSEIHY
jgi:hypothetical protein